MKMTVAPTAKIQRIIGQSGSLVIMMPTNLEYLTNRVRHVIAAQRIGDVAKQIISLSIKKWNKSIDLPSWQGVNLLKQCRRSLDFVPFSVHLLPERNTTWPGQTTADWRRRTVTSRTGSDRCYDQPADGALQVLPGNEASCALAGLPGGMFCKCRVRERIDSWHRQPPWFDDQLRPLKGQSASR